MHKILTIITLSISILTSSLVHSNLLNSSRDMICMVSNSTYSAQNKTYTNTVINENGEEFKVFSFDCLSEKWIVCYAQNNGTKSIQDDIITGYDLLED